MFEQEINVCFLTQDSNLVQVLVGVLGSGFRTRTFSEFQYSRFSELSDWTDVLVVDLRASHPGTVETGLRFIQEVTSRPSPPPIVVLYQEGSPELNLKVMEAGAYDTIIHPPNMIEFRLILRRAFKFQAAEKEIQRLRVSATGAKRLHDLHGSAPAMQELFALAQKIGPCDVNVLITGETGTGKELLARAIHQTSPRAARPIVAFSCANLPDTLIEDELFGHEKGAFTGALGMRRGRLEMADQGSLFLDEVGDLGIGLQPKLLRVLQERSFERLGGNSTVNVNIRLISATNRNLEEMVQQGKFREDLFYRLNVVHMHIPPLRERRDDIILLAQLFLLAANQQFNKKVKRFSHEALLALEEYAWPGNVRELENAVQRAVVLSEGQTVEVSHLPLNVRKHSDEAAVFNGLDEGAAINSTYEAEVRQFKRRLILRTLRKCSWSKVDSARALGVARGYLHRLINQLEINQDEEENLVAGPEEKLPGIQAPRQFS
ncbi:MAG: sigma-54 dependent transcriptional regulator [Candidatus Acidiferrales bacterium]